MKTIPILTVFLFLTATALTQTPDFSMVGFATMNGETTGGEGGQVVTPVDFDELNSYCTAEEPYVILIDKEFKGSNPDSTDPNAPVRRILRINSNKTLLGIDSSGFINQISLVINSKENIIIRNIKFTMTDVPIDGSGSEVKILGTNSDPDIISISADLSSIPQSERKTRNIWIDHCELYNEDPAVMTDKDRYDGLIDIKNDVKYVTISWCYFHDHHKGCLSGSGGSDEHDRNLTMHHNYFDNISSRIPLQRYGKLHLFNNYVTNSENGLNVRIDAEAVTEHNYFQNTKKPIFGKVSEGGTARELNNYFDNCSRLSHVHIPSASSPNADPLNSSEEYNTNDYVIPYPYNNVVIDVGDVPAVVSTWAGVGKISPDSMSNSSQLFNPSDEISIYPTIIESIVNICLPENASTGSIQIELLNMSGKAVFKKTEFFTYGNRKIQLNMSDLESGTYLCRIISGKHSSTQKIQIVH